MIWRSPIVFDNLKKGRQKYSGSLKLQFLENLVSCEPSPHLKIQEKAIQAGLPLSLCITQL